MYTYGPVPSRRLGLSLGVSPIPPKTCSYTCVYCQLGWTTHLQTRRDSFFASADILGEIIQHSRSTKYDYLTFVGDGEPTLYKDLGWLIRKSKSTLRHPIAVITNGSLLSQSDVRRELLEADVVIPSLDAGNEKMFRAVNRPHRSLTFNEMVLGQIDFRLEFSGQIWLEVMLVRGLNDTDKELQSIAKAVNDIQPDRVYITTPIRPPAEPWVEPPDVTTILKAQQVIGGAAAITALESGDFGLSEFVSAKKAIIEIGSRHPLRMEQANEIERSFSELGVVRHMLEDKELIQVEYNGHKYVLPAHFVRGKLNHATKGGANNERRYH
ncbi:MAG: radical SAM protein [Candidatus Zixiibacteriota bacterium]